MPHRKNAKGDIGTAKNFSDSYDADNIYLSEEGWVYRHFKNSKKTMWWDEIIVAGQVRPGESIHGVPNDPVSETNPKKLGTDDAVTYQVGDGEFDITYANIGGTPPIAHVGDPDMETVVIDTDPKPTGFGQVAWDSINVTGAVEGDISTQIPDGWNEYSHEGQTDPSNVTDYPNEPPFLGGVVQPNEYNISAVDQVTDPITLEVTDVPVPAPEPGYEYLDGAQDPQGVIVGVTEKGQSVEYTDAQI